MELKMIVSGYMMLLHDSCEDTAAQIIREVGKHCESYEPIKFVFE